ncbi:MAG: NUDIX domain-containing protein [Bacteroidia bacterium]|jgi:8-oxo-dGTP pyrophosphatase MutT (NUDIX family)|nr:NUDIX domain-containing protein [Bacteroidia bacterium]MBP7244319.1 NUDIX domain-containing protein [Bacteroidia bacterium]
MYQVYINERLLKFVGTYDPIGNAELVIKLKGNEPKEHLKVLVKAFEENPQTESLVIQSENIDETWKKFTSLYTILKAAGGVVINSQTNKLLMIFRNGKWDLPKGKIEAGEEADVAAVREVYEECGIGELKLSKQIKTSFHTYPYKETVILKKTYWFLMSSTDISTPVPQLEEGIVEARWMDKAEVKKALKNAYSSIVELLNEQILETEYRPLG